MTVHAEDSILLAEAIRSVGGRVELMLYPELDHAAILPAISLMFQGRAPVLADCVNSLHRTLG